MMAQEIQVPAAAVEAVALTAVAVLLKLAETRTTEVVVEVVVAKPQQGQAQIVKAGTLYGAEQAVAVDAVVSEPALLQEARLFTVVMVVQELSTPQLLMPAHNLAEALVERRLATLGLAAPEE